MAGTGVNGKALCFFDSGNATAASIGTGTAYAWSDVVGAGKLAVVANELFVTAWGDLARSATEDEQFVHGADTLKFAGTPENESFSVTFVAARAGGAGIPPAVAAKAVEASDLDVGAVVDFVRIVTTDTYTRDASTNAITFPTWANATAEYVRGEITRTSAGVPENGVPTHTLEITPSVRATGLDQA